MKEYMYEGEKYYFNGKRWVDSRKLEVPRGIVGKLNMLLQDDMDFENMKDEELLKFASNIKEGENYQLAIKALETLMDRVGAKEVKLILPRRY